jgi:hypothetical protein
MILLLYIWEYVGPLCAVEITSSRVRYGSVVAAGESILSVCSGELIDDGRCKI